MIPIRSPEGVLVYSPFAPSCVKIKMKAGIHPEYVSCKVFCACTPGKPVTEIVSTTPELHLDICSNCHPFYTGKQKLVDAAGRVEKFMRRYGKEAKK